MPRTLQPTRDADAAVLSVAQRAQTQLPDGHAPLADRLFALECAARGGRAVAPVVERYRGALREAEWWLEDNWEPDVPHAVVVAQALSAADALDHNPPDSWGSLLTDALASLERRQARYGIGNDPALLAAVLRGLAAASVTPPEWLLEAASDVLMTPNSVEATAELAEALARHRAGDRFAPRVLAAAFTGADETDPDAAYARWWLAGRRADIEEHLNVQAVEDARLQALAAAMPADGRTAAMLLEAASCAAGTLIITSEQALAAARSRQERRVLVARALYRSGFFALLLVGVLIDLHSIGDSVAGLTGNPHLTRQCLAGLGWGGLTLCVSGASESIARAYGTQPPAVARYAEILGPLVAGIIGAATV